MRLVDLIWLVEPMFEHGTASRFTGWTSRCRSGSAGVWVFLFARQLRSRALLPVNDPFFKEAFAHDAH